MKPITLLIILLFTVTLSIAQNLNSGGPVETHFYADLPYEQINGKIIVDVEIAGRIHKFLLDTGAPLTVSDELAAELGLNASQQANTNDAYGNKASLKIAKIESVKVGEVNFKNVPAFIGTNLIFKCVGVDGNLGSNLLRNTIIKFNSKDKIISITDDVSKLNLSQQYAIPLDLKKDKQSSPFFLLSTGNNTTGEYFIDTGDAGFMALSNTYMDIFKSHNACQVIAEGYGSNSFGENGAENSNVKHRVLFPEIKIGDAAFKNVKTETVFSSQGSGNNSIGSKLLTYGTLTLDYIHAKLYFEPFLPETDLTEKSWSVSPSFIDGKLVIGVVWDKLKNSVQPGLWITAIDGVPCQNIDICQLIRQSSLLQGKEHATLSLMDKDGKLKQLDITKE